VVIEGASQVQAAFSGATHDHVPETLSARRKTARHSVLHLLIHLLLIVAILAYAEELWLSD
jgi:hypothetical protein